jgi:outer membrane protein
MDENHNSNNAPIEAENQVEQQMTASHLENSVVETQKPEKPQHGNTKLVLILSIISLLGVVVLFMLHFCCKKTTPATANTPIVAESQMLNNLRIVFVDTDMILQNYKLVADSKQQLENLRSTKEMQFKATQSKLENDYNAYISTGASLTLQQQQEKEAELTRRGTELRQMEERFANEINDKLMESNKITGDSVINYIKRFNKDNAYSLILEKSGINGVLYGEDALDITQMILDGLNVEYQTAKK